MVIILNETMAFGAFKKSDELIAEGSFLEKKNNSVPQHQSINLTFSSFFSDFFSTSENMFGLLDTKHDIVRS